MTSTEPILSEDAMRYCEDALASAKPRVKRSELRAKHGTPKQLSEAVAVAVEQGIVTREEASTALHKYELEWANSTDDLDSPSSRVRDPMPSEQELAALVQRPEFWTLIAGYHDIQATMGEPMGYDCTYHNQRHAWATAKAAELQAVIDKG